MATKTGPVCKMCRREGDKLFLKGKRCESARCTFVKRANPPGQHTYRRTKRKGYGIQLREKQKVKSFYGLRDKQFMKYFEEAARQKGNTGENLLILLERRLDNVIQLLRLASSRSQARQFIRHGHVYLNGRRCNISSCMVSPGSSISVSKDEKFNALIKENLETFRSRDIPSWLSLDDKNIVGTVSSLPTRADVSVLVEEQLIVELCSR
ncbi:MAG: 30S ribosomal protein S4 [Planctomycetota bacterium]